MGHDMSVAVTPPCFDSKYRRGNLQLAIEKKGFSSITSYMASRPQCSLAELVRELDVFDLAPMQLEAYFVEEARDEGELALEQCARSLLARDFRDQLKHGWPSPSEPSRSTSNLRKEDVFTSFTYAMPLEHAAACERIRCAMSEATIRAGWIPIDGDDPLLIVVFASHWHK
jgi:hypothetical protein